MPGSDPLRRFQAPQTYLRFPCKTHEHCALPQVVHLLLSGAMSTSEEPECSSSPEGCLTPAASVLSKDYCYSAQIRSSVLQGLPFGGVPTVLVLNFMCFLVSLAACSACRSPSRRSGDFEACFLHLQALLFLFSYLRKVAWDYGRLALVNDTER